MTIVENRYRGSKEYHLIYCELIHAAQHRGLVTYQEIAKIMGLPLSGNHMGKEVGWLIGEISEDEHVNGRPMLSAIVINTQGKPGPGFFGLAVDLGKLAEDDPTDVEQRFWEKEKAAVYTAWQKEL
jgi:hypothetical protein